MREAHGGQCRKWHTCGYDLVSLDQGGGVRRRYEELDLSQVTIDRVEQGTGGVNQSEMGLVRLLEKCRYLF